MYSIFNAPKNIFPPVEDNTADAQAKQRILDAAMKDPTLADAYNNVNIYGTKTPQKEEVTPMNLNLKNIDIYDLASGINLYRTADNYLQPPPKNLRFDRMQASRTDVDRSPYKQASENVTAQGQSALNTVKENTGNVTSLMGAAAQVGANLADAQNQINAQYSQAAQQSQAQNAQMKQQADSMNLQTSVQESTTNAQLQMQAAQAKKTATNETLNAAVIAQAQKLQGKIGMYEYALQEYDTKVNENNVEINRLMAEVNNEFIDEFGDESDYYSEKKLEFEADVSITDTSVYDPDDKLSLYSGTEKTDKQLEMYNQYIDYMLKLDRRKKYGEWTTENKKTQQDITTRVIGSSRPSLDFLKYFD